MADTCLNHVSWSTSGYRNTASTTVTIWVLKAPSTEVYFRNSAWFCWNFSVPSAWYWAFTMVGGKFLGLCGRTNAKPVCDVESSIVIFSTRCKFWHPLRFNDTDTAFPLTNRCIWMSPSIIGSHPIFGRIGVGKSERTPLTLVVAPFMTSCALVGSDDRFIPWENSSNLLKSLM